MSERSRVRGLLWMERSEVREALSEPEEERTNSHTDSVGGCPGQ